MNYPGACHVCGFPPDTPGWIRYELPLDDPRFGKAVPCPECHDKTMAQRLAEMSQLTGWLRDAKFEGFRWTEQNRGAADACMSMTKRGSGWLTVWGNYGCGKTHLLAAVVNRCVATTRAAAYYTLPELLDKLRRAIDDDGFDPVFQRLCNIAVLCIDEMDKARITPWGCEKLYQLIDERYRRIDNLGTVFAMNHDPDTTGEELGYFVSRMHDRRARIVHIAGGDVRPLPMG